MVAYPIYIAKARWTEDGQRNADFIKWWPSDPGEGRVWNCTCSTYLMYRDDPGIEVVQHDRETKWWPEYMAKIASKHPSESSITVIRGHDEEWCPAWFSHWTFDTGQTDREVLASFSTYVDRITAHNRKHAKMVNGIWTEPICLMGAEDRYRWCAGPEGGNRECSDPPCRCEHCQKRGILRIDH